MEPRIQTFTGKKFYPLAPRAEDICIEDIARALSMKCRFGGHAKMFYSVAQHCVLVSELLEPSTESTLLWGLLHDAAEAYLPDFAAPIKEFFYAFYGEASYYISSLEHQINYCIQKALDIPPQSFNHHLIKKADLIALATERHQLMSEGFEWEGLAGIYPAPIKINPLSPYLAEDLFLKRFHDLMG